MSTCLVCSLEVERSKMAKHVDTAHTGDFGCQQCPCRYRTGIALQIHIGKRHRGMPEPEAILPHDTEEDAPMPFPDVDEEDEAPVDEGGEPPQEDQVDTMMRQWRARFVPKFRPSLPIVAEEEEEEDVVGEDPVEVVRVDSLKAEEELVIIGFPPPQCPDIF